MRYICFFSFFFKSYFDSSFENIIDWCHYTFVILLLYGKIFFSDVGFERRLINPLFFPGRVVIYFDIESKTVYSPIESNYLKQNLFR